MEDSTTPVSVRAIGVKFGLIAGLIGTTQFLLISLLGENPFAPGWGWLGAAIIITVIFFAHKSFKDSGDGFMSYGQGVGISFWIALTATALSVPISYIFLTFIDPGVLDLFYEQQLAEMEKAGQPEAAIEMAMTWTKKLFWVFAIIMPIVWDVIIGLILSIFTQKKRPEQTF